MAERSGMNMAITMKPTVTPRNTIRTGSMAAVNAVARYVSQILSDALLPPL